jgi:putative oxidoreductase
MNAKTQTLPKFAGGVNILLWILQVLIAVVFLMAGFIKLSGDPKMVEAFANIGLGQWFRYLTGAIEIGSALMMLVPRTILVGALLLICTMFGAIATHLFVIGDSPLVTFILLLFNVVIFLGRMERLPAIIGARS